MHGDLGSSSVWRVLLEGCHAAWWSALLKRISLELEDEMFFRGKSKSPPVELWDFPYRSDGEKELPREVLNLCCSVVKLLGDSAINWC